MKYSDIRQVQIILSLLKQFAIKHIVISPGTRHVPLVHDAEADPYFTCYSVVDERSAAYFALGLSEALDEPVCFTCTSATATCNYMPAMQEAFERNIPLVALTADRARYQRFHGENQCIDQVDMYRPYVRYAVDLPDVKNAEDEWFCNRCVNEALLELSHGCRGPVQINFLEPLSIARLSTFSADAIPVARRIWRHDEPISWAVFSDALRAKKRILVICGQHYDPSGTLGAMLSRFAARFNAVVTYDYFCNVQGEGFVHSSLVAELLNGEELERLKPDLIITFGSKTYSVLGTRYRGYGIEHWDIDPEGRVKDPIHSLRHIFACSPERFFDRVSETEGDNDGQYLRRWQERLRSIDRRTEGFTNHAAIETVLAHLPERVSMHVSVLNSMRLTNFCDLPAHTTCMGNICADGIDGALSAFLGQAASTQGLSLLIIGDLSYLYDLNASLIGAGSNVRILLINNYAGAEFHYNISKHRIPTLDRYIAASHRTRIGQAVALSGMDYRSASNADELAAAAATFFSSSERPVLLEVFTDAHTDGEMLRRFLAKNRRVTLKNRLAQAVRGLLGDRAVVLIKKCIR